MSDRLAYVGGGRGGGSLLPALAAVGGAAFTSAALLYFRNRSTIAEAVERASLAPAGSPDPNVVLRLTGYWPYAATVSERKMEGGADAAAIWRGQKAIDPTTGKRPVIYTLEQHQAGKAPYVTLSGDPEIWPFGQRVEIDALPGLVFRYTDTGGHFTGAKKVYRVVGQEPTDVAVDTPKTKLPGSSRARVVSGDSFVPGAVALSRVGKPTVSGVTDACTEDDVEALSRVIASLSRCDEGALEAAAWACRNRASLLGKSVSDMVAPGRAYGPAGGPRYASTVRPGTDASRAIAERVLAAGAEDDPTGGAVDFWIPAHQAHLKSMGDLYRAAVERGDRDLASELQIYAGYRAGESAVRAWQASRGLEAAKRVGPVEVLRLKKES